jgi:hypothetical protein
LRMSLSLILKSPNGLMSPYQRKEYHVRSYS